MGTFCPVAPETAGEFPALFCPPDALLALDLPFPIPNPSPLLPPPPVPRRRLNRDPLLLLVVDELLGGDAEDEEGVDPFAALSSKVARVTWKVDTKKGRANLPFAVAD